MALRLPPTLSDHPSLVGILRMPTNTFSATQIDIPLITKENGKWETMTQAVEIAREIIGASQTDVTVTIPKSNLTDFYPYTYYVLTDNECEPLILQPQYMEATSTFSSLYALSHQPIERYYCKNYKGDSQGRVYNITNINQMMLPTGSNEGTSYMTANASQLATNRQNMIMNNVLTGISTGFAIAKGLANAGAKIAFNDINQDLVNKGIEAYKAEGIDAKGYVCDVTDEAAVTELIAKIEKEVASLFNLEDTDYIVIFDALNEVQKMIPFKRLLNITTRQIFK